MDGGGRLMRLRLRQTLFIGMVGLACTLVTLLTASYFANTELRQGRLDQLQALSQIKRAELQAAHRSWIRQATLIASRTQLRRLVRQGDFRSQPEAAQRVRRILQDAISSAAEVENVRVLGLDGDVQLALEYTVTPTHRIRLADPSVTEAVLVAILGEPRQVPVVTVQVPMQLDGEHIGYLQVDLRAIEMQDLASGKQGLGRTGEIIIAVRESDGGAVFLSNLRHRPDAAFVVRVSPDRTDIPVTHAVNGRDLVSLSGFVDYRERPVAFATASVGDGRWGIVVKQDLDEAIAPVLRLKWRLLGALAAVILLAVLLAYGLSAYDASRLEAVQRSIQAIQKTHSGVRRRSSGRDELEELASAVSAMAAELDLAISRLRASESMFRTAFENAPIGVALVSTDGRWLEVNQALCGMLGYRPEELLGRTFQEVTHPADLETDLELVAQMLRGDLNRYAMDKRYFHKDSRIVPIRLNVSLIRDAAGRPVHFISQIEDRSESHRAEQQRQQLLADLQRSNSDLEDFAYTASHDLKAPLRAITGFAQLLRRRLGDRLADDEAEMLTSIELSAKSLNALVEELLRYARLGRGDVTSEPVSLRALAQEVASRFSAAGEAYELAIEIDDALPTWTTDPIRLGQVLQNLFSNAIKYNDEPVRRIRLSATDELGRELAVDDNGIGIPEQHRAQVFTIFKRLHVENAYGGGAGAGLTIVQKLMRLLGGQIRIEDSPLGGTRFVISLQAAPRTQTFAHKVQVDGMPDSTESPV